MNRAKHNVSNLLVIGAVIVLITAFQGCDGIGVGNDFLDKPPSGEVTIDTVFSNEEDAENFLWNAYRSLPYYNGVVGGSFNNAGRYDTDLLRWDPPAAITDINQSYRPAGGASSFYYTGSYTASVEDDTPEATKYNFYNSGAWDGIRQAHIFLENADRVPDMDDAKRQRLKAEARMIIAVHYSEMFRHYGGMPWVDHAYSPNDDIHLPRLTARATLDSVVAVIERAIPDLPFALNNPSSEAGRFTRAGAMGLKARVLLFGASPLFNDSQPYMQGEAASEELVWFGGEDPSLWQDAADAARDLIDEAEQTGAYYLLDDGDPRQNFQDAYYTRESPEMLISTRKRYRDPNMPAFMVNGGSSATTHNYVQMFPMADGTPIDEPGSGYDPDNPYENRDPRLYESVLTNGDDYQNRTAELWIGGRERETSGEPATATGYHARKFILDITDASGMVVHWPHLRLPEIYLSYAEALNEANSGPTSEAYEYINKVRNRVDLGDLPNGLSQEEFREAVLRERVLEFGYENVRWFDIVRWKMEDVFTKNLYGMNITQNDDGSFNYDQFELPARDWKNNFSPKWYLSAFPVDEINKQYGLIQNPGWE